MDTTQTERLFATKNLLIQEAEKMKQIIHQIQEFKNQNISKSSDLNYLPKSQVNELNKNYDLVIEYVIKIIDRLNLHIQQIDQQLSQVI